MTKKVLILLLALSMVCSSLFAAFALDDASVNEGCDQSSGITTKDESEATNTKESELNNEAQGEEATTDEESLDVEEIKAPSLQSAPPQGSETEDETSIGTVTLVGQWTNKSRELKDTTRTYGSLNDIIGIPETNGGLLRGLAKTFLGWSDKAPVGNGTLAEGARLYSPYDKIGMVKGFESGIPTHAKLYAVYFSLNKPEDAFPDLDLSKFSDKMKLLSILMEGQNNLKTLVNQNTVRINKNISSEGTLLNTENDPNKTNTDQQNDNRTIIDYYSKTDDIEKTHEVVLEAEFTMNDTIAMLVYKNPTGSNQLRPILSRNYAEKYKNNSFGITFDRNPDYTYMDLVVNLDPELKLPDGKLYLEFDAYSWRPLYVLDAENNPLNIVNPNGGEYLGNDSKAFSSLVNTSPSTIFAVDLNNAKLNNADGNQQITLRTVLREGKSERISEESVKTLPNKTIAETILSNMKLRTLKSEEIQSKFGISEKESNQSIVRITDKKASELADTKGEETLKVTGFIEGFAISDAGLPVRPFSFINREDANSVYLGYTRQLGYFLETHRYETLNEKGEVIDTQIVEIPAQQGYARDMYSTQMKLREGFKLYSVSSPNKAVFSADGKKTSANFVEGSTLSVEYVYRKAPKQVEKKSPKAVQTGDTQSMYLSIALAITCLAGIVAIRFKKSR